MPYDMLPFSFFVHSNHKLGQFGLTCNNRYLDSAMTCNLKCGILIKYHSLAPLKMQFRSFKCCKPRKRYLADKSITHISNLMRQEGRRPIQWIA